MMKTKCLLAALFAVISINLSAQEASNNLQAHEMAMYQTETMRDNLRLTPGQVSRIESVNLICAQMQIEQQRLKKNVSYNSEQMSEVKSMMMAITNQRNSLIKSILTDEQYRQYALWQGN